MTRSGICAESNNWCPASHDVQYIPRNMHTVFALLCFVVVIHWLIFPYPSGLLHWHCGNLTIAPVPAKQPWWIWINTSCEFIMNDCITTTKQNTTKPCAYFFGYTVSYGYSKTDRMVPWIIHGLYLLLPLLGVVAETINLIFIFQPNRSFMQNTYSPHHVIYVFTTTSCTAALATNDWRNK